MGVGEGRKGGFRLGLLGRKGPVRMARCLRGSLVAGG